MLAVLFLFARKCFRQTYSKQFQNNKNIPVLNAAPLGPLDEGGEETIYTEYRTIGVSCGAVG